MDARAWRLAGGAGTALLVLVALVAWRADSLAGGWLLALRLTGLLAVLGLSAAVVLGALAALRPPAAASVVVRVRSDGPPQTAAQPGRKALVPLTAVLLLAVLSALPVLVVLVLATGPRQDAADVDDDAAAAGPGGATTATPSTAPSTAPSTSPSTATAPSSSAPASGSAGGTGSPPASPSPTATASGPPPAPSPSQLPSDAGAPAVCDRVVVAGDSLWSIAEQQLGAGARDADVDARWRAVYARNAAAVGPDPDLVHPGLVLRTCA